MCIVHFQSFIHHKNCAHMKEYCFNEFSEADASGGDKKAPFYHTRQSGGDHAQHLCHALINPSFFPANTKSIGTQRGLAKRFSRIVANFFRAVDEI